MIAGPFALLLIEMNPGSGVGVAGSALVVLLAAAVAFVRPHSGRQRALIVYALALGLGTGVSNFRSLDDPRVHATLWAFTNVGLVVAGGALLWIGWSYARAASSRRGLAWRLAPLVGLWVALVVPVFTRPDAVAAFYAARGLLYSPPTMLWGSVSLPTFSLAALAACVFVAVRARRADAAGVREAALVSSALALYPAFFGTSHVLIADPLAIEIGLALLAGTLWLSVLWLAHVERSADPRASRNAALVPPAAALAGLLFLGLGAPVPSVAGVSRILTVAVLAYAILRHSALGIDAKLRYGISKSTIAAIFISVFFIASEGAQQFFGDVAGSQYVGILVAGALVFALAPLQRLADRLAVRAVPGQTEDDAETLYRRHVELAWSNGSVSPKERLLLRAARQHLGVEAARADAIEHEVEQARHRGAP